MQSSIPVSFKKLHPDAVLPSYATPGDAGLDLVAVQVTLDEKGEYIEYDLGISVQIPEGFEGQLRARSSVSKYPLVLANGVGTVDSGYRGPLKARFKVISTLPFSDHAKKVYEAILRQEKQSPHAYMIGERVVQLVIVPIPRIVPMWADDLTSTQRGEGGFGSSGN